MSAELMAEIRRLAEERDTAERRVTRLLTGVDQAIALLSGRPENQPQDAQATGPDR